MGSHRRKLTVRQIKRACATTFAFQGDVVQSMDYWEGPEISDSFNNKRWKEVSNERLLDFRSSQPHFTDEAYRYFLPAYLVVSIGHPEGAKFMDSPSTA